MSPMSTLTIQGQPKPDKKPKQPELCEPVGAAVPTYFKGVRSEWGKISWPTWPQIWGQTIVVLVMVSHHDARPVHYRQCFHHCSLI